MDLEKLADSLCFGGRQQRWRHRSATLGCEMTFSIYLPPQAAAGTPLPVLYWLSGLTCTDENFVQKAGAQRTAAELGLILVCPDTSPRGAEVACAPDGAWDLGLGAGFYLNASEAPWAAHYRMHDYVADELPALVQGGPGLPLGGDLQHLPLETASPGQGEGAAAQHQALRLVQPPGTGGDVGPEGLHVLEEPRLGVPRCRGHGGQAGVGLGEVGQQGGGGAQRGILCQYDAGVVFCHCTGKAARSGTAVADRKAAGRVDAQQDHPESSRKPPHPPGAKAGFAGAAHSFTKALRRTTRLTVYNVANLL